MASNESPEVAEVTEHVPAAYEPPPGAVVFSVIVIVSVTTTPAGVHTG